ncbi:TRAP transporter large permease subunit [Bacillus idriensis]|uniref:TRAP transporter large permease subunit n=1 Tax=Metabacillus idriensis TaxID=324768 RepID=A0A6I2M6J5_9BACI|nr:TRAP transporter large permease [Metabacillus idriensis]MRX52964.1 TRAP transporter large permease subunit [Metabacillus idriensis]
MTLTAGLILLSVFFVLLIVGVPIAISIAGASIATMLILFPFDVAVFTSAQKMVTGLDSFALLAVPFFVLSGIIMNNGGIAIRLINLAKLLAGRMPGSLAHTNVLGNMLFGSISGSSVASAAAIGGVMSPLQDKEGYERTYSAAVNIASAPTGLLIPPSSLLIIYSLVSGGTSVAALFIAGYVPGILWGLATMLVAFFIAKKKNYPIAPRIPFSQGLKVFLDAIPSLLLIVVVLGGIIAGVFTATEGAAIAVAYSLILSIIYRTFSFKKLPKMLLETVEMTAVIMLLIGTSTILSLVMSFTGIPEAISSGLLSLTDSPIIILLLMNVILLIIGTFIDITPAVLIFTPIFLPVVTAFGMDPVHFGIMMAFNLCIGNITPPVGSALFVGCSIGKVKMEQVIKPLLPFYGAIIVVLLAVTFIPEISLSLPKLFGL